MPSPPPKSRSRLHRWAALLGVGLLVYLVERAGPANLLGNARTIGWGMVLVLALAGVSHVLKTWAWRLVLPGEYHKVPFSRTLGLRLASEAVGQFGLVGQIAGETLRVSLLGSAVPVHSGVSSVTLDRGLFIATGALVSIAGLLAATVLVSLSGALRFYAAFFTLVLTALLTFTVVAVRKRWPVFSGTARAVGRLPWFRERLQRKESVIESAERQLLKFHRDAPRAFWASLVLNLACHMLAIVEVFVILRLLGTHVTLVGALILESLTKLINVVGAINPGNVGTYEGGNMVIGKLFGLTAAEGLTLGLCRRFRAIFWAVVGAACLAWFSRSTHGLGKDTKRPAEKKNMSAEDQTRQAGETRFHLQTAIILADVTGDRDPSRSVLARVGALPLVLRAILGAHAAGVDRIIVAVNPLTGPSIRNQLVHTKRFPPSVEWVAVSGRGATLPKVVGRAAMNAHRVSLIMADRAYHPSLHQMISEWDGEEDALELSSNGVLVGMIALSHDLALEVAADSDSKITGLEDLHTWVWSRSPAISGTTRVFYNSVSADTWQAITCEEDRTAAEHKLDRWLVKPTDGVFARMNRRVSIPISRQLIKCPITPNMVSLFTLGVSLASGLLFARGGYWCTLAGAVLSVWASILDGCDGEVARLKLQVSDFGCWLETMCDYLYYLFVFAGMAIGLARSTGKASFLAWGGVLFFGALLTFIMAGIGRQQLSGGRPERYLAIWQKTAERHLMNPLIYIGRYTEFMVRRCFLPYALLVLALLNLTAAALYLSAIGANLAWIISLCSFRAFAGKNGHQAPVPVTPTTKSATVRA